MTSLPPKPPSVAHVSDALWDAALRKAYSTWNYNGGTNDHLLYSELVDHARCLIALYEVEEPITTIPQAAEKAYLYLQNFYGRDELPTPADFVEAFERGVKPLLENKSAP